MDDPGRTEAVVEVFVELTSIGLQVNAMKDKLGQQQNQFQSPAIDGDTTACTDKQSAVALTRRIVSR
jgi:hypothetical protein